MRLLIALLLLSALAALPAAAQQPQCAPLERVEGLLAEKYQETRRVEGITAQGPLLALYASAQGETWTLVLIRPDGLACMFASGTELVVRKPAEGLKGEGL